MKMAMVMITEMEIGSQETMISPTIQKGMMVGHHEEILKCVRRGHIMMREEDLQDLKEIIEVVQDLTKRAIAIEMKIAEKEILTPIEEMVIQILLPKFTSPDSKEERVNQMLSKLFKSLVESER